MVLGNLGYCLFLAGDIEAAEDATRECLQLGQLTSLNEQRTHAALHRVEPEDSDFEHMLDRLWVRVTTIMAD